MNEAMLRGVLIAATAVVVGLLPGCAGTVGDDPRAKLTFTRAALLQSSANELRQPESERRQYVVMFRVCRILDERGRQTTTQRLRYVFSPREEADGPKVAVLDDLEMDAFWRLPRIASICEPHVVVTQGYPSSMPYSGAWQPESPDVLVYAERRNDEAVRVKLEAKSPTQYNRMTVDSLTVDVPDSKWVAMPCVTRGTDDDSGRIPPVMSAKDEQKRSEDLLLFLKVEDLSR